MGKSKGKSKGRPKKEKGSKSKPHKKGSKSKPHKKGSKSKPHKKRSKSKQPPLKQYVVKKIDEYLSLDLRDNEQTDDEQTDDEQTGYKQQGISPDLTHYEEQHCSPKQGTLDYSCLSGDVLFTIAKAINSLNGITLKYEGVPEKVLYKKICNVMQNNFNCKNEACWLNIRKLMNKLSSKDAYYFREHFRPKMPEDIVDDYTKWISNFDIEAVLRQHHEETPGVYSYGAVPIDFKSCSVSSDLCKINLKQHIDKNENKLAMVFNTDDSKGPGQHWFAMYVDVEGVNLDSQPGIYFFDSFASKPMKEVKELIEKIKDQGSKLNKEFVVTVNDKVLQKNTFSCGFYSMHFLEQMIDGTPFSEYINSGLNDKKIIEYRNHCFLHPKDTKTG
jgi:hypothetical protein